MLNTSSSQLAMANKSLTSSTSPYTSFSPHSLSLSTLLALLLVASVSPSSSPSSLTFLFSWVSSHNHCFFFNDKYKNLRTWRLLLVVFAILLNGLLQYLLLVFFFWNLHGSIKFEISNLCWCGNHGNFFDVAFSVIVIWIIGLLRSLWVLKIHKVQSNVNLCWNANSWNLVSVVGAICHLF